MKSVYTRLKQLRDVPDYESIISNNQEFEDSQFKPDLDSLFSSTKSKFTKDKIDKWKLRVQWKRIKDIYKKNEISIVNKIRAYDVEQGEIGDWYLMSTLSSIAYQQPTEISKLFITKEFNESGIYAMNLLISGRYQVIVVDDYSIQRCLVPLKRTTFSQIHEGD